MQRKEVWSALMRLSFLCILTHIVSDATCPRKPWLQKHDAREFC